MTHELMTALSMAVAARSNAPRRHRRDSRISIKPKHDQAFDPAMPMDTGSKKCSAHTPVDQVML